MMEDSVIDKSRSKELDRMPDVECKHLSEICEHRPADGPSLIRSGKREEIRCCANSGGILPSEGVCVIGCGHGWGDVSS